MTEELEEEIMVLQSIYGEESVSWETNREGSTVLLYQSADNNGELELYFTLSSANYPPIVDQFVPLVKKIVPSRVYQAMRSGVAHLAGETQGEESGEGVLWRAIELCREILENQTSGVYLNTEVQEDIHVFEDLTDSTAAEPTSWPTASSSSSLLVPPSGEIAAPRPLLDVNTITGEPVVERKSTFQAHFARVTSMAEVIAFRENLLADRKIARATHNIFAYRFTDAQSGLIHHDCDDDGESAAGGRLAEILRLMDADGVAVVVSRWFGGILLGPDRFKFINNAARNLLELHGIGKAAGGSGRRKKAKG